MPGRSRTAHEPWRRAEDRLLHGALRATSAEGLDKPHRAPSERTFRPSAALRPASRREARSGAVSFQEWLRSIRASCACSVSRTRSRSPMVAATAACVRAHVGELAVERVDVDAPAAAAAPPRLRLMVSSDSSFPLWPSISRYTRRSSSDVLGRSELVARIAELGLGLGGARSVCRQAADAHPRERHAPCSSALEFTSGAVELGRCGRPRRTISSWSTALHALQPVPPLRPPAAASAAA